MRTARLVGIGALALFAALVPAISFGQAERAVALDWRAPAECPDASYVMGEVARQLAGSSASPDRKVSARADVSKDGSLWRLRLVVESGDKRGERALPNKRNQCASIRLVHGMPGP